jgi:hypothetical protein
MLHNGKDNVDIDLAYAACPSAIEALNSNAEVHHRYNKSISPVSRDYKSGASCLQLSDIRRCVLNRRSLASW